METSNTLLKDRVAIVTGGGDGIGKGIALMFARSGAHVVIADRNGPVGEAAAAEVKAMGRKGLAIQTDVRKSDQVSALVSRTVAELGGVDIMVNNVGGSPRQDFLKNGETRWQKIVDLNLMSMIYGTSAAVQAMIEKKRGGSIINISSIEGSRAAPGFAVYSACKGGMDNFTKTAALEFAAHGIRVNCIAPDIIDTPTTAGLRGHTKGLGAWYPWAAWERRRKSAASRSFWPPTWPRTSPARRSTSTAAPGRPAAGRAKAPAGSTSRGRINSHGGPKRGLARGSDAC